MAFARAQRGVRAAVWWLVLANSGSFLAAADEWLFTIDAQSSRLEVSGQFAAAELIPQDSEGLSPIAPVSGWITVELDDPHEAAAIELTSSHLIVGNSGDWLPQPLGGPALGELGIARPANFAMWFDDAQTGQGWGAVRGVEFDLRTGRARIDNGAFPAVAELETLAGAFDYNVPSPALADLGQEILTGELLIADARQAAGFRRTEFGAEITFPIHVSDFLPIDVFLDGEIVARVEFPWRRGDFDVDGQLSAADIDLLSAAVRRGQYDRYFDLNTDGIVDQTDRELWVHDRFHTYYGDADLNGRFESADLVSVLAAGEYENPLVLNSGWQAGDWDGDGKFLTTDLVVALQDGGFEAEARLRHAVPESWPAREGLLLAAGVVLLITRRRDSAARSARQWQARGGRDETDGVRGVMW